jgi:TolA-binding protein
MRLARYLASLSLCLATTACITPSEKKQMKDDLFTTETRVLNLERLLTDTSKEGKNNTEAAVKRIASTQTELERMSRELQQIRGEIDALKVGVTTGEMPGMDQTQQQNSLASKVKDLSDKVDAMQTSQNELLDALKKAGLSKKKKSDKGAKGADNGKSERKAMTSVAELQKAFDDKHYKWIAEDGAGVVKSASSGEKEQARFLVAESYFKLGDFRNAALKYNDFLDGKPQKKYVPLAKMHMGDAFRKLGDSETAKVYYEELIKEFPSSDEAAKAKDRLADQSKAGGKKG